MTKEELKKKYGKEKIAVIKNENLSLQEGFNQYSKDTLRTIINNHFFINRYDAEFNHEFRQPIGYILLRHKDTYFATLRLNNSGEERLVGNISLGTGGHINQCDSLRPGNIISNSVIRELHEELNIDCNAKLNSKIIGFIYDSSNDVGKDHVGVVVLIDISKPLVTIKETDKLEGKFVTKEYIKENYDKLESWSKIVFDYLLTCENKKEDK